jgi:hypothetical protein
VSRDRVTTPLHIQRGLTGVRDHDHDHDHDGDGANECRIKEIEIRGATLAAGGSTKVAAGGPFVDIAWAS